MLHVFAVPAHTQLDTCRMLYGELTVLPNAVLVLLVTSAAEYTGLSATQPLLTVSYTALANYSL